ncbi:MAG: Fur family transcriptional regulator [Hyphomicrobiales bacterium]
MTAERRSTALKKASAALLARAERLCHDKNLRFTPMRRRVLQELASSPEPLTAYDLADRVREEKRIAPVTVYRALEFLLDAKLIHRIVIRNAYTPCDHAPHYDETPVFLVCTHCGAVDEVPSETFEHDLSETIAEVGFKAKARVFEIEGECAKCQAGR